MCLGRPRGPEHLVDDMGGAVEHRKAGRRSLCAAHRALLPHHLLDLIRVCPGRLSVARSRRQCLVGKTPDILARNVRLLLISAFEYQLLLLFTGRWLVVIYRAPGMAVGA